VNEGVRVSFRARVAPRTRQSSGATHGPDAQYSFDTDLHLLLSHHHCFASPRPLFAYKSPRSNLFHRHFVSPFTLHHPLFDFGFDPFCSLIAFAEGRDTPFYSSFHELPSFPLQPPRLAPTSPLFPPSVRLDRLSHPGSAVSLGLPRSSGSTRRLLQTLHPCEQTLPFNAYPRLPSFSSIIINMATTEPTAAVNGNYTSQVYDTMANNYAAANANSNTAYGAAQPAPSPAANTTTSEIPKDEVGWYFVEQYYTTLSRSPEKLFVSRLTLVGIAIC